ncbi:MAG TPA: hypothetical protein VHV08_02205, partial [Pirellulales bacterium]|nr:hypothetical protein [Pirellulales bacterium]
MCTVILRTRRMQPAGAKLLVEIILAVCWTAGLQAAGPIKRVQPPKFDKSVTDLFFPDARQKLVGPRPERIIATP